MIRPPGLPSWARAKACASSSEERVLIAQWASRMSRGQRAEAAVRPARGVVADEDVDVTERRLRAREQFFRRARRREVEPGVGHLAADLGQHRVDVVRTPRALAVVRDVMVREHAHAGRGEPARDREPDPRAPADAGDERDAALHRTRV